jgi:TrmH family RNA methyltransferase
MSSAGDPGSARRIVSRDNTLFRELLHLAGSARERRRREASLIEGVHLCEAYLQRHGRARKVLVAESALDDPEVAALIAGLDEPPVILAAPLFKAISAVEHGVGIALLIDTPRPALPARIEADTVYLDRLQDPGNVGTILRTCAAAGVRRVLTAPGTAWCWSPKVLRAGMGAHFHLEIHESVGWAELVPRLRVQVRATTAVAEGDLWDADLRAPALWLFGQEGGGLAAELLEAATLTVSIPQAPAVESLNVGVAAALCLYEQMRQRRSTRLS